MAGLANKDLGSLEPGTYYDSEQLAFVVDDNIRSFTFTRSFRTVFRGQEQDSPPVTFFLGCFPDIDLDKARKAGMFVSGLEKCFQFNRSVLERIPYVTDQLMFNDQEVKGLRLRVTPGKKSFYLERRIKGRKGSAVKNPSRRLRPEI